MPCCSCPLAAQRHPRTSCRFFSASRRAAESQLNDSPQSQSNIRPLVAYQVRAAEDQAPAPAVIAEAKARIGALREALEADLNVGVARDSADFLPVYWGNRNWDPFLSDALTQMRSDGVLNAAVVVTSGYSSYSGCRQYRENLYDSVTQVQADATLVRSARVH